MCDNVEFCLPDFVHVVTYIHIIYKVSALTIKIRFFFINLDLLLLFYYWTVGPSIASWAG